MATQNNRSPLSRRKFLVVDDELALRKSLQQRFEEEGAEVRTADSVNAARKLLGEEESHRREFMGFLKEYERKG